MKQQHPVKLGISVGDLNGIGCEVALKSLQDARILTSCTPVFFASTKTLAFQKQAFGLDLKLHGIKSMDRVEHGKINVLSVFDTDFEASFGTNSPEAGRLAVTSLEAATKALKEGQIDALVTAPINKSNVQSERFSFPGHTDYLAKELGGEALMFMISEGLRVGLLTDHIAVSEVSNAITTKRIRDKVKTMNQSLIQDFGIVRPRIALLGINPHSGDDGTIGSEDDTLMKPAIASLFDEGILAFGPYAADGFFGSATYTQFDGVIAAYHDQGLVAFKTLSFGQGVNYTAGLSRVRTSPDHGTAYAIAGKGEADPTSFTQALYAAVDIYKRRTAFQAIEANKLKPNQKKAAKEHNA
ncbi:MAG: 4-Hydroxythreonine-4-phosphate dehydrogenase [Bacteroidota bacterium]|jgi:4-hydroxythreonine-4-phosphate dehydrogenase